MKGVIIRLTVIIMLGTTAAYCQYSFGSPESATYDPIRGRYLVSDQTNGDIIQIDSLGNYSLFSDTLNIVKGLIVRNDTLFGAAGWQGVAAFDLETAQLLFLHYIPGMVELNDIAADSSGNIYVSDAQGNMIHKLHLPDMASETMVTNFARANGLWYDVYNDRLLAIQWIDNCPISAIDPHTYEVTVIRNDGIDLLDGITKDCFGYYYVSSFGSDAIYRYDTLFSGPPTLFSTGHVDPGDIYFNPYKYEIAVPYVTGGRIAFVRFVDMAVDTTYGYLPLDINFTGSSLVPAESWHWNFGDGTSADGQDVSHIYQDRGLFDVTLEVTSDGRVMSSTRKKYIAGLADSLIAPNVKVIGEVSAMVEIYATNSIPLNELRIPVEYQGVLSLKFDSVSTIGCRTELFDNLDVVSSDETNRRLFVRIKNNYNSTAPDLEAGDGAVLRLYFTINNPSTGFINPIIIDGYSTNLPLFSGPYAI
ncbi:MAG: PKD domain-containing protein, partial [Candidatus Zixiibacteriota bacterium]